MIRIYDKTVSYKNVTMGCNSSKVCKTESQLSKCTDENTDLFEFPRKKMRCKVVRVYDGDTIWVVINFKETFTKLKCRMLGYDSPEMKPKLNTNNRDQIIRKAIVARDYLKSLIENKIVDIQISGFDKYGRVLSTIYIVDPDSSKIICRNKLNVNNLMIRNGYGYSYMGGTKQNM